MKEKIGEDDENDLLIKNEIKKKKPSNNRVMLKKLKSMDYSNIKRNSKQQNIDLFFLPKRVDRFGEPILPRSKGGQGKHKVTFIDRITKNNFAEVIKIESFKEYNKMEEVSANNRKNYCCLFF